MTHRDMSVAVCGAVLGVILAAGSVAFVSGDSFTASALDSTVASNFHQAPNAADYSRRRIDARGLELYKGNDIHNYPTLIESSSSSSEGTVIDADITACTASKRTVAKLRAAYNALVPDTFKNTELRQRFDAAFATASNEFCDQAVVPTDASSSSVSTVRSVNNHCEKYSKRTIRYSQCVIAEEHGAVYPYGQ